MRAREASVGMTVRITDNPRTPTEWPEWVSEMDQYKGKNTTITRIYDDGEVDLNIDKGSWCWHTRWLTLVPLLEK